MRSFFIALLLPLSVFAQENKFTQYVDPFIGTGGHGHTFPGATTPFGMVQLSPDTRTDGSWDGCSGYHYSDSVIYGFSHTHLSGTGCSDWGDIMIMPTMGNPSLDRKDYSSKFYHSSEKASAGYYKVKLEDDAIDAEMTATTRVGFHKYTFNNGGTANFIIDLNHRDKLILGEVKVINDTVIEVMRRSEAWAKDQVLFARIIFSRPVQLNGIKASGTEFSSYKQTDGMVYSGTILKINFSTEVNKGESILVKVAISPVSVEGAKKNLQAEIPDWDFDKVKKAASASWNNELSKIEVTSENLDKMKVFYTALYHCMIHPSTASDVDGKYRGMDNKIYTANGFTYYSVFSLWDTFRALHPLLTIIDRKRTLDFVKTFLEMYKQTGRLPVWELSSNETDCMIGYHAVSVIADAYIKGIKDFDTGLALKAMTDMSNLKNYRGLDAYRQKGFLETEDESENVSKTLEYAYDDWCIAQFAKAIGKDSVYKEYLQRSQSWKNVFNPETGFMQPRSNGGWEKNFDPKRVDNNFTEGNSWQYSFFVPQDIPGLIERMGGPEKFEKKLDELFTTGSRTTGRDQSDITGLIGQYAHGNEPSHHMAYLYDYVGKPEKTRERVKQILNDFYKPTPDGLIGNEDCGQMSAWYVMSSMGIYSVCPGKYQYVTGPSIFKTVKFNFDNGSLLLNSPDDPFNKNVFVKPKKNSTESLSLTHLWLIYLLTDTNSLKAGKYIDTLSVAGWADAGEKKLTQRYIPSPVISASSQVFSDSILIEIRSLLPDSKIEFACVKPGEKNPVMKEYTKPFYIHDSKEVIAAAKTTEINSGQASSGKSRPVKAKLYKRPNNWKITILSKYNPQYTAGGDEGLIDGLRGDINWRKGRWQGYQGQDFECIIDLGKEKELSKASAGFLQDSRSWILMPVKMEVSLSSDGKNFTSPILVANTAVKAEDNTLQVLNLETAFSKNPARYVKIRAFNYGKLPDWHQGAGGDAFIFIDEISIE